MAEHIVVEAGLHLHAMRPPRIHCLRCGASQLVELPMVDDALSKLIAEWTAQHRNCPPPATEEPPSND